MKSISHILMIITSIVVFTESVRGTVEHLMEEQEAAQKYQASIYQERISQVMEAIEIRNVGSPEDQQRVHNLLAATNPPPPEMIKMYRGTWNPIPTFGALFLLVGTVLLHYSEIRQLAPNRR